MFFTYIIIICCTSSKNPEFKTQITVKTDFSLMYFNNIFLLIDNFSIINCPILWQRKQSFWTYLPTLPPILFLKKWNSNFECVFSVRIWRIDLVKACRVVPIFLFFMPFSGLTLLTFSKYPMMQNVSYVLPGLYVSCNGYFIIH